MKIAILAGGRGKTAPEQALAASYLERARDTGKALGFGGFVLTEFDERQPQRLSEALSASAFAVLLDERGEAMGSVAFATWLAQLRDQGVGQVTFGIGAADGFGAQDRARARKLLSFGPQTWPHTLVRTMLAEQLFRAMTILAGHPYHRV
ncbi:MAG TPA: 23S rRNA (pseudouridine(1915)-N(3))-methyltransferase RlmH [Alphaproteobacteria bacterium]|nr:23S rRNA (pseudouridine(1915)-N(3))-methyltransferase RlmH [Alphaproteobacteria bacterium]